MKSEFIHFQVRTDEYLKEKLKLYAAKKGMTMSECIRYILRKILEEDSKHEN